jgi:eukaryotic-like serine/threonine-protein kinase
MSAARVLIAEDKRLIAEELRDRLERMGLTVTAVVNSGEDAIARVEETSPHLVLMDMHLKGVVDGIAAASTIRERFGIPTVYLTTLSDDATVERAKHTYPLGYLVKPVAEKELEVTLKVALQHHAIELRQHAGDPPEGVEVTAAAQPRGFVLSRSSPSPSPGWSKASPISPIEPALSNEAIQEQLQKILSSPMLVRSKRLVRFLSFIVDKELKGEGRDLNEYPIGIEVYERPSSFDPQIDTIVRTEARRLRLKLRQYYETEGNGDPILIEVPKGSYAPTFRARERGILDRNPGQLVSHYRLLEKLGQGRLGTVYLAEDSRLGRQVALKFIHTSRLKEKQAKERLFREARAAAAIDHPNVAAIYEVSEVEQQPFIAMAYVKGQELEERISAGPMEIAEALDIACQLADGLEAAHRQGVVHCDLSPANVILSGDGRVRIIDFGVAKLSSSTRLSKPTLMGTANYVSPEQMRGEAVDQRTDIWSLGVILYEILTGKRPFEADHREAVYYAIAHRIPEPMSRWRAGITEELESIVFKCLEKEPSSRYQDAATLKAHLSAQSEGLRTRDSLPAAATFPRGDDVGVESRPATPPTQREEYLSLGKRPGGPRRFLGQSTVWIVGATLAALLVWVGSNRWFRTALQQQEPGKASATAAISIPRLVILPFESRTPGEENQALSYAISDSLITNLAKLRGLQVTSWTTVMRLTERKATLPEIAKILNVQYALEGSLLRSGQRGHLTAQLIRVSDDTHIWADEFDFPWEGILTVWKRVSESVARLINVQLQPEEQHLLAQSSTHSNSAYQAHARGRYSLVRFSYFREPGYLIEAEKHFKRALEEDPQYADVLADLAYLCYQRFYPPRGDRKGLATQGIAYAERALAINPNNVVALYVLGSLYDLMGESAKGLELCQRAVRLRPNDPEAHHHLAWRYLQRGFYESGIAENSAAIAKDTLFMDSYFYNVIFLGRLGRIEAALEAVNQLEELEPTSPFPTLLRADIAFGMGDLRRAEAGWRQVLESYPKPPEGSDITPVLLAAISARKGQVEEARQVLNKFETSPSRATDYPIKLAALVGEKDLAIDLIRNSSLHRNYRWLVSDPDIASLRNEPRFRELLVELYRKWQHDLATLGPSLPVPPPKLPTPEEYLSPRTR